MVKYFVRWEVEVEADIPRDAAKMASRIQQVANDEVSQVAAQQASRYSIGWSPFLTVDLSEKKGS